MDYEIFYSLRKYLETELPELTKVQLIYDDVELSKLTKPFATVQSLQVNSSSIAAGRQSYEDIYRYQSGIYARGIEERMKLESRVRNALRNAEGIPLYDGDLVLTEKTFVCDVSGFTPMFQPNAESDTDSNYGFFDISVDILTIEK